MEYQALYRKYRPQRFDQMIGQDHVTQTLLREIADGRVAHAYLFAGPRGTGKTTTARLLAKSLNCPHREPAGEPCDDCVSCTSVAGSSSMDVMELDAASHNKVDDIRDLKTGVTTVASVGGAKRVFILDEAHMLSKAAGNALLKTLEEPPDHVHFVLATTEPYRLLDTVRSRSQRFDFQLVPADLLAGHLERVSGAEGFRASPEALLAVARRAAGSVRDALSLLEQVAALDGSVTREGIRDALGAAGPEALSVLVEAVVDGDAKAVLDLVAGLAARGVDLRRFVGDAIAFFRGVFLSAYTPKVADLTDEPPEVITEWQLASERLAPATVMRAIDQLGETLVKLREGREERVMMELALLKLVRPELDDGTQALLRRIEKLERDRAGVPAPSGPRPAAAQSAPPSVERSETRTSRPTTPDGPSAGGPSSAAPPPEAVEPASAPDERLTSADLERIWPQLVAGVRDALGVRRAALFRDAIPGGTEGTTLVFTVPAAFHLKQLSEDSALRNHLADHAGRLLDRTVSVSFRAADGSVLDSPAKPKDELTPGPPPELASEPPPDDSDAPPEEPDPVPEEPAPPPARARAKGSSRTASQAQSLLEQAFGATVVDET